MPGEVPSSAQATSEKAPALMLKKPSHAGRFFQEALINARFFHLLEVDEVDARFNY